MKKSPEKESIIKQHPSINQSINQSINPYGMVTSSLYRYDFCTRVHAMRDFCEMLSLIAHARRLISRV